MLKSIRALKAELSACMRRVQAGEECLVKSHNQVVAKIVPIQSPAEIDNVDRKSFIAGLRAYLITAKENSLPLSQEVVEQRKNERY